jgi:hypothetical protein
VLEGGFRFDVERARAHLARFSEEAFRERVRILIDAIWGARP